MALPKPVQTNHGTNMSWILLTGSAVAIIVIVILNRLLGGYRSMRLTSRSEILQALERDNLPLGDGLLTILDQAGRCGLAMPENGERLGLVLAMGDGFVTRDVRAGDIQTYSWTDGPDGGRLEIRLKDFSLPDFQITPASEEERRLLRQRLSELSGGTDA